MSMYLQVYIGSSRLLELPKPWGKGVGWDVNVHVNLRQQLMLRTRGVGWVGWDVNVHVNLRLDVNIHVNLRQQLMMM